MEEWKEEAGDVFSSGPDYQETKIGKTIEEADRADKIYPFFIVDCGVPCRMSIRPHMHFN